MPPSDRFSEAELATLRCAARQSSAIARSPCGPGHRGDSAPWPPVLTLRLPGALARPRSPRCADPRALPRGSRFMNLDPAAVRHPPVPTRPYARCAIPGHLRGPRPRADPHPSYPTARIGPSSPTGCGSGLIKRSPPMRSLAACPPPTTCTSAACPSHDRESRRRPTQRSCGYPTGPCR